MVWYVKKDLQTLEDLFQSNENDPKCDNDLPVVSQRTTGIHRVIRIL